MKLKRASLALAVPVTALAAVATPAISASAAAAAPHPAPLPCHAWVSNSKPRDYSTVDVWVATAKHAAVTTVAHYRTKNTKHTAWASNKGDAEIAYRISDATPGYKVKVSVAVVSGHHGGSCSTSVTPKHR
jgi:hypothetical protein